MVLNKPDKGARASKVVNNPNRRMSLISPEDMAKLRIANFNSINEQAVETILNLNDATKLELTKIDNYAFNIF